MNKKIIYFFCLLFVFVSCVKYESACDCIDVPDPTPIIFSSPHYFPEPNIPKWNPLTEEGVDLGRHLFYDPILSSDNTVSCASCHKQEHSFGDNTSFCFGVNGAQGERHSPTLVNSAFQETFDWDGKSHSLEDQAPLTIFSI